MEDATRQPKRQKAVGDAEMGEASAQKAAPPKTPGAPAAATGKFGGASTHSLMPMYYGRLFPYKEMYKWLAYGNDRRLPQAEADFFQKREFCFTLDGDIFVRYQSFRDAEELFAGIREQIDIGPVYNVDPRKRDKYKAAGGGGFVPVERELVFDVDMTDYDDVRTCCAGADICGRCWGLMTVAIQVVDAGLRADFGFDHLLWVYSGRRGVHCWVCDDRARRLSDEQRSAVAEYFAVYKGSDKGGEDGGAGKKKVYLTTPLHPSLQRAYAVLSPYWMESYLPQQRPLDAPATWAPILAMIPDTAVQATLRGRWAAAKPAKAGANVTGAGLSVGRWHDLEKTVNSAAKAAKGAPAAYALRRCLTEIVFAHVYPRLDMEVSKKMNHLLKAPFCVHPKTGRVCVPIDPARAAEFDPLRVPTVAQLLNQLDASGGDKTAGFEHTTLAGAVALFKSGFLDGLLAANRAEGTERARDGARDATAEPTLAW